MKYILYTLREGGNLHQINFGDSTEYEFKKALRDGKIVIFDKNKFVEKKVKFVSLVEEIDNFDFVIGKKRG